MPSVVNRACLPPQCLPCRPPHVPIPSSPVIPTTLLCRTTYLSLFPPKNQLNTVHTPHHTLVSNCISTSLVDARRKKVELFDEVDHSGTRKYRQRVSIDSLALAVQVTVASVPTQLIVVPTKQGGLPDTKNRQLGLRNRPLIWEQLNPRHSLQSNRRFRNTNNR